MFQTQVNINQALGVPGDRASSNASFSELSGPGALVAGADGVMIARFAWINSAGQVSNTGLSTPDGFVAREQQALINLFTDQYSMQVPAGFPITVNNRGEFLAVNSGTVATARHGSVYANSVDGKLSYGASASDMAASFTAAIAKNIAASTCSLSTNTCTAAISGTTMTVSAIVTGAIAPGQVLTGTSVASGTNVVAQLTGTAGSTGTYTVSISQTVASTTITGSGGCLTVVSMTSGTIVPGQTLTGTGVTTGNTVLANVTGTGGAGKYYVSVGDTVSSQAITGSGGTMTVSAVASGDGAILPNAVFSGTSVTSGSYILGNLSGSGGLGTYWTSVSETVSSFSDGAIAGSVDTGWKWASVVAAGEIGKISSWTR